MTTNSRVVRPRLGIQANLICGNAVVVNGWVKNNKTTCHSLVDTNQPITNWFQLKRTKQVRNGSSITNKTANFSTLEQNKINLIKSRQDTMDSFSTVGKPVKAIHLTKLSKK